MWDFIREEDGIDSIWGTKKGVNKKYSSFKYLEGFKRGDNNSTLQLILSKI